MEAVVGLVVRFGDESVDRQLRPDDELSTETYNQNGNVTASGGKTFTYDAENHLVSMGSTVTLVYDGDGNRVSKTVNGVTTKYLVDDLNPTGYPQVIDELTSGAVTRTYTYGLQRISQYQVISNTWTPSFYGYDGFGSVRNLTNSAGAITDSYEYDGFGNSWTVSGTTPNEFLYRGEQWDSDLGLYYLRARYYNPLTGRFMSRDPEDHSPMDPNQLHKYLYVGGDPVNAIDPTGRGDEIDVSVIPKEILKNIRTYVRFATQFARIEECVAFGLSAIVQKPGTPFSPELYEFAVAHCLRVLAGPYN